MTAPSRDQSSLHDSEVRINIAAALFDRLVAIESALRDVVANGFITSAYSILVGVQSREFALLGSTFQVPQLTIPVHRIDNASVQDGAFWIPDDLTGPDGGGVARSMGGRSFVPGAGGAAMQGLERHGHRLHGHFTRGGAVLIARVESLAEQHAICSMLLHYASDGVLTHQVRASAARQLPAYLGPPPTIRGTPTQPGR